MLPGKLNAYLCPICGGLTTTIDLDDGVTPFMLGCRATGRVGDCAGMAESRFYRGPFSAPPVWEWYRPSAEECRTLDSATREHVRKGGLLIRRIAG